MEPMLILSIGCKNKQKMNQKTNIFIQEFHLKMFADMVAILFRLQRVNYIAPWLSLALIIHTSLHLCRVFCHLWLQYADGVVSDQTGKTAICLTEVSWLGFDSIITPTCAKQLRFGHPKGNSLPSRYHTICKTVCHIIRQELLQFLSISNLVF